MFSIQNRMSAVFYNMISGMLFMGAINYLTGFYGPERPLNNVSFKMTNIDTFNFDRIYEEEFVAFQFDMKADIRELFNWNTNIIFLTLFCEFDTPQGEKSQVVVWDQRIPRDQEEFHQLDLEDEWIEYHLTDLNKSLKGKKVDVYMRWWQMTTIGPYYSGTKKIGQFEIPDKYTTKSKRGYVPGPSGRKVNY